MVARWLAWALRSLADWLDPLPRSGWKLVPVNPTNAMLKAASAAMSPGKRPTQEYVSCKRKHKIRYQAMLVAAPVPKPTAKGSK